MAYYIGPRSKIVGRLFHGLDNWMQYYFVGEINPGGVFDKGKAKLGAARVSPQGDVGFKIIGNSFDTVVCLLRQTNEEQVHCVDKPLSAAGATSLLEATEEPKDRIITITICVRDKINRRTICTSLHQIFPSGS